MTPRSSGAIRSKNGRAMRHAAGVSAPRSIATLSMAMSARAYATHDGPTPYSPRLSPNISGG